MATITLNCGPSLHSQKVPIASLAFTAGLQRNGASDRQSVHQTTLRQIIVDDRLVLHRAVIPHHNIAFAPSVLIEEFGLDHMIRKRDDQSVRLLARQTSDTRTIVAVDVEASATGARMRSDDWVLDGRITVDRSRIWGFRALTTSEVENSLHAVDMPLHRLRERVKSRSGVREGSIAKREAMQFRNLYGI